MNKALIAELQNKAQAIGHWICRNRLGGRWSDFDSNTDTLQYRITGEGSIEFYRDKDDARIGFFNIKPRRIDKSVYHKPELSNTVLEDVNSSSIVNSGSDTSIERTYTYTEDETISSSQDVGVDVAIGLRQQIGYGGAVSPVSGETEISISISAHYNKTWGSESSKGKEVSNTVEVPPRTEVTISTQKSKSDFYQKTEHYIEVDSKIGLWSEGGYDISMQNIKELEDILDGVGKHGHPLTATFKYQPAPQWEKDIILKSSIIKIENEVNFSNASTGSITVTERKL